MEAEQLYLIFFPSQILIFNSTLGWLVQDFTFRFRFLFTNDCGESENRFCSSAHRASTLLQRSRLQPNILQPKQNMYSEISLDIYYQSDTIGTRTRNSVEVEKHEIY